jgi:mannosyltransferase OCH1-like enzyme
MGRMGRTKKLTKRRRKSSPSTQGKTRDIPDLKRTIPKVIHQVYGMFGDGIPIQEIPVFSENVRKTKAFCKTHKIRHKMWGLPQATKLIQTLEAREQKKPGDKIPFRELWTSPRFQEQPILKADFIRYCILYEEGGLYVDCDIHPIRSLLRLFRMPFFFVTWSNDKKQLPYNAVLGTYPHNPLYREILTACGVSFYEKLAIPIYKTWKGRFVFQTTGHFMLQRVLKSHPTSPILKDVLLIHGKGRTTPIGDPHTALFEDANASVWYGK